MDAHMVGSALLMPNSAKEDRRLAAHLSGDASPGVRCWSCGHATDRDDRYCRRCGQGQGAFLAWYYRPLWIVVLALTVLGPFVLPLVWRTPSLERTAKWIASLIILGITCYVGWELAIGVTELGRILGVP